MLLHCDIAHDLWSMVFVFSCELSFAEKGGGVDGVLEGGALVTIILLMCGEPCLLGLC